MTCNDDGNLRLQIQLLATGNYGFLRLKPNTILRQPLDIPPIDPNEIVAISFDQKSRQRLAQLIGYSLNGAGPSSNSSGA